MVQLRRWGSTNIFQILSRSVLLFLENIHHTQIQIDQYTLIEQSNETCTVQGRRNRSSRSGKCQTKDSKFILKIIVNPKPTIDSNLVTISAWCLKECNDYSFYLHSPSVSATKVFQISQMQVWNKRRRPGISSRLVREIWYDWLHSDISKDAALCYLCMQADHQNKYLSSKKHKPAFIKTAFCILERSYSYVPFS